MRPKALQCTSCGAPVTFRSPSCAFCRAALRWGEPPELEPGRSLFSQRYPASPLLGSSMLRQTRVETRPEGALVHVPSEGAAWAMGEAKCRDMCVTLDGIALDSEVGFGVLARAYAEGSIVGAYVAMVLPSSRAVRLARILEGGELSVLDPLTRWESLDAVAPVGQPNAVELRVADSMLQVLVNAIRVISVIDAGILWGAFGWRVISLGAAGRVLFRGIDARDVA